MSSSIQKTFEYGHHTIVLETGVIARQAASVWVRMGDTVVLVTVVYTEKKDGDFFPLMVVYQERAYAVGRIPGGYFKREGRPSEKEILTSRLIDRPLRPLFPEDFRYEVQIIATVLSADPQFDPDIAALIGASAALSISGLPFQGPIGAARVAYNHQSGYYLNPSVKQLLESQLDLVVAGTDQAVLMVESQAAELSEETMLGAIAFGQEKLQTVVQAIKEFAQEVGKTRIDWQTSESTACLEETKREQLSKELAQAYCIEEKKQRKARLADLLAQAKQEWLDEEKNITGKYIQSVFSDLERTIVRSNILTKGIRIDSRDARTIRPITIKTAVLPRVHGSALFTRGETQALVVTTLGTDRDAQLVETFEGETRETFMLHYNFPPYSVGETGPLLTKRRDIGHGTLAKRAVRAVLPSEDIFPHVIRVVSEITESNGSSSMATVCGTSLALMDAGVPIKKPVAGIAMGLIKEGEHSVVLSDILGDEDHLGDMDFKVAGTVDGITALQMDIKIQGITSEILRSALQQAQEGRLHILGIMKEALSDARIDVSPYAPRITTIRIKPEKIAALIGKAGSVIRSITEETGSLIDISDDGLVRISTTSATACADVIERIKRVTADVEVDSVYQGTVIKITDFGAFVSIMPGRDGLVHISQIADKHIERVTDVLTMGDRVTVKVLGIDRQGRVRLTMKDVEQNAAAAQEEISVDR